MATYTPVVEDLSEFDESKNLLVYADSGVGKTVLGGSDDGALILAIDKGTVSAARRGSKAKVIRIGTWDEFVKVYEWLRAGACKKYTWVVVDGLTMLWEKCMRSVLDAAIADNPRRDQYIPAMPDHQKVQLMLKDYVGKFCDLKVDVLFTALPMNIETKDGDEIVIPNIHGQKGDISHYICGLMSAFGRMSLETIEDKKGNEREVRRITWKPTGPYTGKDRYGVLAPHTDDITLPEINRLVEESATRPATSTARRTSRTRPATRRPAAPTRRRTA